jgi:twinkle protein
MITQESISELKQRINIVEVISDYTKLSKSGHDYECKCPFHDEKTASFKVSKSKQIYKCFGCGKSGDAIDFVISYRNVTYIEAIKMLASKYHVHLDEVETQKRVYKKPDQKYISTGLPENITKWFEHRGISTNTLNRAKVTGATEWMPKAKTEVEAICFNYFIKGELVNIKFRAKDKDFKLCKDAQLVFYNLDSIAGRDSVVIVEGEIDCLSLIEAGITCAVSVPNGASNGTQRLEYLDNCWELFEDKTTIIIMTDNDNNGLQLRDELARRLGKERCLKVVYPDGCKDANEILLKHGKQAVIDCIDKAVEFPIEGIISMHDMYEDVADYYMNGYPKGIKIGINEIDDHISFMPGQFTTITGIPGSGKSEVTDWFMAQCVINHGWSFAVCSFENQPSSLHVTKIMEKLTGKSFMYRYNHDHRINQEDFARSTAIIDQYFHFININQIEVTLDGILEKAKELVVRKGIKGLLIDPWNYIEHKVQYGQTETQYISECLTKIKAFALTNGIHIFLIAHPVKLKKEGNKYEVPTLYSISGSAHFFNKTDNGLTIYRDFETNLVTIYIQKVRYSWLGKIGYVSFNYNTETRQYQLVNN